MAVFILKHQKKAKRSVLQINKNAFQKTKTQSSDLSILSVTEIFKFKEYYKANLVFFIN